MSSPPNRAEFSLHANPSRRLRVARSSSGGASERRHFVKLFIESLIHLPRDLWRPTLVILDEAHIYCPERGSGEAESTDAVISLMSQGRKRGYAGIIATQRLSKLHKDAAAEANR